MRIPLIIRAPQRNRNVRTGARTGALTESIDIYPTLCELAGLPSPPHLQGRSLVPLLKNPNIEWDSTAVGRFQNGDTIRSTDYRFTRYTDRQGRLTAKMLYDHANDPDENVNRISDEALDATVKQLETQLQHKLPPTPNP